MVVVVWSIREKKHNPMWFVTKDFLYTFSSNGQFKWYIGEGLNITFILESTDKLMLMINIFLILRIL